MNDDVRLSIRQFSAAWRLMCAASPHSAVGEGEGLEHIFSGLPLGFFNIALLTDSGLSAGRLSACGRRACEWAADKGVPWMLVATHENLEPGVDAAMVLDGAGFAPLMPLTGMVAQRVAPASRTPDGLHLTVPHDDAACSALLEVNSKAYAMDLEGGRELVGSPAFWKAHFPVLGLIDGKPASCATVMMVEGHRYVALVATEPDQQRRGYAGAAMRWALDNAAAVHGERPTVLHATDAGRPIYERMGYTTIATHTVFMEKRFLVEH